MGGTEFNEGSGQYWSSSNSANGGSAISYIPEMVWNDTPAGGGLLASGGGASIYFPKPAWQSGPGVPADNARDIPDVSFNASGDHDGYMVVNANGQRITGGTSASSPSFAGVIALLNQYVVTHGLQTQAGLGNINPNLYRLAQTTNDIFHDITQGNDVVPCVQGSPDCVTGSYGFTAGPGYDLATGWGSIDVANLVTAWPAANDAIVVTASPASITLGDTVQLTATISGAAPSGTVTFSTGTTILGIATLVNVAGTAMATLTVTGPVLPVGATTVLATYSGNSNFNGSTGSVAVQVASQSSGSSVLVSITPNPAHAGQVVKLSLTEENGVGTTITGWTINGSDRSSLIVPDFGSASLPPHGAVSASFSTTATQTIPAVRLYQFTGMDAGGRTWSQQFTLILVGTSVPDMLLSSVPSPVVLPNPLCQGSQQLLLEEQNGLEVQLTRFLVDGRDMTDQVQTLFGTTRLAPFGALQATICSVGTNYEIDGTTQIGEPVQATLASSSSGPPSNPGTLSVSSNAVVLAASSGASAAATIPVSLTGGNLSVSMFPSNQTTSWLTSTVAAQQVSLQASSAGLAHGVYEATLILQATSAIPQVIEIPVVFEVGASSTMSVGGVSNGASFRQAFAPGMILSVFGTQLAPSVQPASSLPLPLTLAGVSATVNGIAAPLYYVSPGQLNIQVPYEVGAGSAVLGVNNNGQVASYIFTVAPSAPGIFTDSSSALVPFSSGQPGDTLTLFITGEGDISPSLATGASPFTFTPLALLPQPRLPLSVTVGGVTAAISFAGIPPGLAGVTQVNFVVPSNVAPGVQPVLVTVGGVTSVAANLTVTP